MTRSDKPSKKAWKVLINYFRIFTNFNERDLDNGGEFKIQKVLLDLNIFSLNALFYKTSIS